MMNARSKMIVFLIFTVFMSGCGNSSQFPLSETTGVVLCEGQPVPFVTVYFSPVREGEEIIVGKGGQATTAEDGTFSISTYKPGDGAVITKHDVRVAQSPVTRRNCPAELSQTKIVQTLEVVKGKNHFTIELPKRTRKSAPIAIEP